MNLEEWLTEERAQGVIEKVNALLNQEAYKHMRQEGLKRICDMISTAQEGLDLAFAAGTLSTPACTAREDSAKYRERYSSEDAKKAMVDAKAGLKIALEKAKDLEKDNFKQMKHWLRKDEDTSAYTVMFFDRMKKEIKRSLKVTIETIKHPGARRKRNRSSVQVYPSLPTTIEVTEENTTSDTAKWVNNNCTRTTKIDNEEVMSTRPPDYEQSEKSHQNVAQKPPAYNVQDTDRAPSNGTKTLSGTFTRQWCCTKQRRDRRRTERKEKAATNQKESTYRALGLLSQKPRALGF